MEPTMTSPISAASSEQRHLQFANANLQLKKQGTLPCLPFANCKSQIANPPTAFTLAELIAVIGIIILLVGIALPAIINGYRSAERNRVAADLQMISAALEAYRADFGDYPRLTSATRDGSLANPYGAQILCWALMAPGQSTVDGYDGFGFRTRSSTQGRVYGPYLQPDKFKLSQKYPNFTLRADGSSTTTQADNSSVLLDRFNNPILYYPARNPKPNIYAANGYVSSSTTSLYNSSDNSGIWNATTMQAFLTGSTSGTVTPSSFTGPYLLWSAGPDGYFGPVDSSGNASAAKLSYIQDCDDITNFK